MRLSCIPLFRAFDPTASGIMHDSGRISLSPADNAALDWLQTTASILNHAGTWPSSRVNRRSSPDRQIRNHGQIARTAPPLLTRSVWRIFDNSQDFPARGVYTLACPSIPVQDDVDRRLDRRCPRFPVSATTDGSSCRLELRSARLGTRPCQTTNNRDTRVVQQISISTRT